MCIRDSIYDINGLVVKDTATFRIRWLEAITLDSVLVDPDDELWLIEKITAIGRRQYLDVAASNYEGITNRDRARLGFWPLLTDPYTSPPNWNLTRRSFPVQNIAIRDFWTDTDGVVHTEQLAVAGGNRDGIWTARFNICLLYTSPSPRD